MPLTLIFTTNFNKLHCLSGIEEYLLYQEYASFIELVSRNSDPSRCVYLVAKAQTEGSHSLM